MSAMSTPAAASASASGSPGPGRTGRARGSPWNRRRSAGSVMSAVLNPVSRSSQPPSHSSSTPGTGSRSRSSGGAPSTDTDLGRSSQPSVSGSTLRTPAPNGRLLPGSGSALARGGGSREPSRVQVALGDDHGGAGEPAPAVLQGDVQRTAGHGDPPGAAVLPVRPGRGHGGGDGAGATGPGLARSALVHPHGLRRRPGLADQLH